MGLSDGFRKCALVATVPRWHVRFFFENKKVFSKNWGGIDEYELKIWELLLEIPRFRTLDLFLGID